MALLALAQVVVVTTVLLSYPETAHRELEELNPEDAAFA
jgi:methionine-rich copper-binding protein CopC